MLTSGEFGERRCQEVPSLNHLHFDTPSPTPPNAAIYGLFAHSHFATSRKVRTLAAIF